MHSCNMIDRSVYLHYLVTRYWQIIVHPFFNAQMKQLDHVSCNTSLLAIYETYYQTNSKWVIKVYMTFTITSHNFQTDTTKTKLFFRSCCNLTQHPILFFAIYTGFKQTEYIISVMAWVNMKSTWLWEYIFKVIELYKSI